MHVESLAYSTDLALLALGNSTIEDRGDHLVIRTPDNPTYWWGNFVLLDGPDWPVRDAVDLFEASFPEAEHLAIGIDGAHITAGDVAAFAEAGYVVERSVAMTTGTVQPPPRPASGFELRTFASDEDWQQRIELSCAVNEDHEPESYRVFATAKAESDRTLAALSGGAWFGAFADDRLVSQLGVIPCGDGLARYQSVETHPDFRQRGLAGTLVCLAGDTALRRWDCTRLVMVADPDYVACRVYQSVGFAVTESTWEITRGIG